MGQADEVRSGRVRVAVLAGLLVAAVAALAAVRAFVPADPQTPPPGAVPDPPPEVVRAVLEEPETVGADVLAGLAFQDVTAEVGFPAGEAAQVRPHLLDGGAAVTDVDGDGDHDVLLTSAGPASGLWRNDGGRFTEVTRRSGLDRLTTSSVARFADVDGDRDVDLFVGGPGPDFGRLLVNDGSGRFVDRSAARGVVGRRDSLSQRRAVRGADFGDVDLDGDLDLVVTDWNPSIVVAADAAGASPDLADDQCAFASRVRLLWARQQVPATGDSRLLLNDGSGHFSDRTREWGLSELGITLAFTPQLHDLDGDGWLDLTVAGDACSSQLYRNDAGRRFTLVTPTARVGTDENGMGSLVHDLDGDHRPDWLVTSIAYPTDGEGCPDVSVFSGCSGNRVYLNEGDLRFRDATDDLGLRTGWWGWGVGAADLANDGGLQVAMANGRQASEEVDPADQASVYYDAFREDPARLFTRRDDGTFVDVAAQAGLVHDDVGHALVPFDYDGDGRLDVLIANAGAPPTLFRNVTTPARHWLGIRLLDQRTPGNREGLGSRVEVTRRDGTRVTHWMHTSGSYQSHRPAEVHVGLGAEGGPVVVRVWWPGADKPQVAEVAPADRVVTIPRRG